MDNFNKNQQCFCQYCGRECKSINSLKQHECRCKENPNKIPHSGGWEKGKQREISPTKNTICISDGVHEKYIKPSLLNDFLIKGWYKGRCEKIKNNSYNSGKAKTIELENIRKEKISKSMKNNPLSGGYRIGSGRGHQGWYKNIYCDSSWELAFVCYYIEHNMNIQRCKEKREYIYHNEKHYYLPDFVTNDGIIEIKGFSTDQWRAKENQNPDIKVLYYNDIKKYIDYVVKKYGTKFWEILYNK